jgi:hypothetical protein
MLLLKEKDLPNSKLNRFKFKLNKKIQCLVEKLRKLGINPNEI